MKIALANLKGGVGKSTLSVNLAVCLAHQGHSVVIVDTDTNRNSQQWYAARDEGLPQVDAVGMVEPEAVNKVVDSLNKKYNYVILDGTPSIGAMTSTIILACDLLVIPIKAGANDYRALSEFVKLIDNARAFRKDIKACFVVNEYNERITTSREIREALQQKYSAIRILDTAIKTRTAYVNSSMNGTGVLEQNDPKAKEEILSFATEVLEFANSEVTL